ncbi:DUF1841 family protein [Thermodesulfobacteriota bacterium]
MASGNGCFQWQRVKQGDLEGLSGEEMRFAEAMRDHKEDYFDEFEAANALDTDGFDPEKGMNPLLHVSLHVAIEEQLELGDPKEALQFCNAMKKKCSRHEAVHLMMALLMIFIVRSLRSGEPLDNDAYAFLLKKYKNRRPEKILDLLDEEDSFLGPEA